jgi:hypothetical protein
MVFTGIEPRPLDVVDGSFDHPTWLYLVPRFTVMGNELNFDLEVGLQVDGLCDAITDAEEILYWMGTGLPWHHAYESEWRD